ncbi:MAG: cupin domain-containing protein [bacterium]|nr:cupin domain-containing protein [bacterium]
MVKVVKRGQGKKAIGPAETEVAIFVDEVESLSIGSITFQPGQKTENHTREVDETLYIIEGRTTVVVNDEERFQLEEGDCIHLPAGTTHRHENNSTENFTQLWIFSPSGPEKDFKSEEGRL